MIHQSTLYMESNFMILIPNHPNINTVMVKRGAPWSWFFKLIRYVNKCNTHIHTIYILQVWFLTLSSSSESSCRDKTSSLTTIGNLLTWLSNLTLFHTFDLFKYRSCQFRIPSEPQSSLHHKGSIIVLWSQAILWKWFILLTNNTRQFD